jgi:hypothetical protein
MDEAQKERSQKYAKQLSDCIIKALDAGEDRDVLLTAFMNVAIQFFIGKAHLFKLTKQETRRRFVEESMGVFDITMSKVANNNPPIIFTSESDN